MKIRNGFVSNSSSSSFIVAVASENDTRIKANINVDLTHFTQNEIKTKQQLDDSFLERYGWGTSLEELLEGDAHLDFLYNTTKRALDEGKIILMGEFCTDNCNPLETALAEEGISQKGNPHLQIIESDPF